MLLAGRIKVVLDAPFSRLAGGPFDRNESYAYFGHRTPK
jgi:hypothetical protein